MRSCSTPFGSHHCVARFFLVKLHEYFWGFGQKHLFFFLLQRVTSSSSWRQDCCCWCCCCVCVHGSSPCFNASLKMQRNPWSHQVTRRIAGTIGFPHRSRSGGSRWGAPDVFRQPRFRRPARDSATWHKGQRFRDLVKKPFLERQVALAAAGSPSAMFSPQEVCFDKESRRREIAAINRANLIGHGGLMKQIRKTLAVENKTGHRLVDGSRKPERIRSPYQQPTLLK